MRRWDRSQRRQRNRWKRYEQEEREFVIMCKLWTAFVLVMIALFVAVKATSAQQIMPAMWAGSPCDSVSYNPPWFAPDPWPEWGDSCYYHVPDGRVAKRFVYMDEHGMKTWGVALRDGRTVLPDWEPSAENRVYDPCNYIELLGRPGYPGICLRTRRSVYR